jgi:hypothetical protein
VGLSVGLEASTKRGFGPLGDIAPRKKKSQFMKEIFKVAVTR